MSNLLPILPKQQVKVRSKGKVARGCRSRRAFAAGASLQKPSIYYKLEGVRWDSFVLLQGCICIHIQVYKDVLRPPPRARVASSVIRDERDLAWPGAPAPAAGVSLRCPPFLFFSVPFPLSLFFVWDRARMQPKRQGSALSAQTEHAETRATRDSAPQPSLYHLLCHECGSVSNARGIFVPSFQ